MIGSFSIEDIRDTIECFPDPVILLAVCEDGDFRMEALNEAAWAQFQFKKDALGKSISESYFTPEIKERMLVRMQTVIETEKPLLSETDFILSDGTTVWMSNHVFPVTSDGGTTHLMITSSNVTTLVESRNRLNDSLVKLAGGFVSLCAWCRKVQRGSQWVDAEELPRHKQPDSDLKCPQCVQREQQT